RRLHPFPTRRSSDLGAGDDTDAIGFFDELAEGVELFFAQAELIEVEADVAAIEHAHDDALAEHGGQDADAKIDGLIVDRQFDARSEEHTSELQSPYD